MSQIATIEIETAIRRQSWITQQVGQKSLHVISVDFGAGKISHKYSTGTTDILGIKLSSIRDIFSLERTRFNGKNKAYFSVTGQTASAVQILPNINYRFDFEVSPNEVAFSGAHDGYPSYSILVNSRTAYDYAQGFLWQLAGSEDIKVDRTIASYN